MTKEELKKEAIKYAVDYPTSYGKGYKHKDLRIAYLAAAEPREKRIAELEATNKKISDECHKLVDTLEKKQNEIADFEKENTELKSRNAELKGMYAHSAREAETYKQFLELKEKENAELKEKIRLMNEQEARDIISRFPC